MNAQATPSIPAEIAKVPAAAAFPGKAEAAYAIALAYEIDNLAMFAAAADELKGIVTLKKQIEAQRLAITRPMDAAKQAVMDFFRTPIARLEQAEGLLRKGMLGYEAAVREKSEAARREAEARAAAERAEAERREREALEAAQAAQASGDVEAAISAVLAAEEARESRELAEVAPPPAPIATLAPKASGISTRQNWKADVTDFKALVIAAAKRAEVGDDFLLGFLTPNEKALNASAKAMQAKLSIPGVRVFNEPGLTVKRKAG